MYKVNSEYSSENERGLIWNDTELDIAWPMDEPIVAQKDNEAPNLENIDNNFVY